MRIEKCNFCSTNVYPGKGTTFVRNDSRVFRYCRKKCRLAFMKKKNPVRTKWTKASRVSKQKELSTQINQVFEMRRIVMKKYDKEAMENTLKVLPEVLKMVQKKKDHHIMKRLAVGTEKRKEKDLDYVNNKMHLIRAPQAQEYDEEEENEKESEKMDVEENLNVNDILNKEPVQRVKCKPIAKVQEMI